MSEEDKSPVMNLNKMSTQERRRLSISPNFRERLSAVFSRKANELTEPPGLKPIAEGGEGTDASKIPNAPPPPTVVDIDERNRDREIDRERDRAKYTGAFRKKNE